MPLQLSFVFLLGIVDKVVFQRSLDIRTSNVSMNWVVLELMGKNFTCTRDYSDSKTSARWRHRYKSCHMICGKVVSDELKFADAPAAAMCFQDCLPATLEECTLSDIYSVDEIGLMYLWDRSHFSFERCPLLC